jgi:predicted GNAT family acetyltransferase
MITAQMIAANTASLDLYRRAWIPEQSFEVRTRFLALADKAARTVAVFAEALDRHRGRGQQQIVVKHVTVNADQAVVADQVVDARPRGGGGGDEQRTGDQPHAKAALAHAQITPVCSTLEADGAAMPRPGG